MFVEGLELEVDEYLYPTGIKELFSEISVYQVKLDLVKLISDWFGSRPGRNCLVLVNVG